MVPRDVPPDRLPGVDIESMLVAATILSNVGAKIPGAAKLAIVGCKIIGLIGYPLNEKLGLIHLKYVDSDIAHWSNRCNRCRLLM